jgi:hypothetical protein
MRLIKQNLTALLFVVIFAPSGFSQSTAQNTQEIKNKLDSLQADFATTLEETASEPEDLTSGETAGDCETIKGDLANLESQINEAIEVLGKRESEISSYEGLSDTDKQELKQAINEQRTPLESCRNGIKQLQSDLKSLLEGGIKLIAETYTTYSEIAGPDKAKAKVAEKIAPLIKKYKRLDNKQQTSVAAIKSQNKEKQPPTTAPKPPSPKVLSFTDAKTLADQGDAYAQAVVSIYFSLGYKTSKDTSKAAEYALRSANQKHPLGIYRVATILESGDGLDKNTNDSARLKEIAFDGLNSMTGDPYALTALAILLFRGEGGLRQDREQAVKLYKRAADQGYAPAQYNYSVALAYGQGAKKNESESKVYWRMAYNQSYPPAMKGAPTESSSQSSSTSNKSSSTFFQNNSKLLSSHITLEPSKNKSSTKLPRGILSGKKGFLNSPYAPGAGFVDVRGMPSGTEVSCPFTGKSFLIP